MRKLIKSSIVRGWHWSIILLLAGCSHGLKPVESLSAIEDENPTVRIWAIKWAGENKISAAVPLLVDRLLDQDQVVRLYAIRSLRLITGENHGYNYNAAPIDRVTAVDRWRVAIRQ